MSESEKNRPGVEDVENETAPTETESLIERGINYAHTNQREITAWGLFVLLFVYVGAEILPIMPEYAPDAGVVGAIATTLISLLATGKGNGNGNKNGGG